MKRAGWSIGREMMNDPLERRAARNVKENRPTNKAVSCLKISFHLSLNSFHSILRMTSLEHPDLEAVLQRVSLLFFDASLTLLAPGFKRLTGSGSTNRNPGWRYTTGLLPLMASMTEESTIFPEPCSTLFVEQITPPLHPLSIRCSGIGNRQKFVISRRNDQVIVESGHEKWKSFVIPALVLTNNDANRAMFSCKYLIRIHAL